MVNRLILNLRSLARDDEEKNMESRTDIFFRDVYVQSHQGSAVGSDAVAGLSRGSFLASFIGNLGAPLEVDGDSEDNEDYHDEGDIGQLNDQDSRRTGSLVTFEDGEVEIWSAKEV